LGCGLTKTMKKGRAKARPFAFLDRPSIQRPSQSTSSAFLGYRTVGDWKELPAVHERAGISVDAKTAAMRGRGGPMDYGLAMDALLYLRRNVSAETRA